MGRRRSIFELLFGRHFDRLVEHISFSLHSLHQKVDSIMASQAELAARLTAMKEQNEKARAENAKLLQELRDAIANGGQTTPEVDAALAALAASIQAEDDENLDSPAPGDGG